MRVTTRQRTIGFAFGAAFPGSAKSRQGGFTLLELIAAMVMTTILTTVVLPAALDMVRNNRQAVALNTLSGAVYAARSEAISRARGVSLCPSADFSSCSGASEWQGGWILFTDIDRDGVVDAGTDTVLKVFNSLGDSATLKGGTRMTFSAMGIVQAGSGSIAVCDSRGDTHARGIRVATTGMIRQLTDTNDDHIVDDGASTPVNVSCS